MIPIKRKSFINRYRNCVMCLYFLCGSSQSNSQRSIIVLLSIVYPYNVGLLPKSYGFFTYVSPHTWVVVLEPIVIQSCFTTALDSGTDNHSKNVLRKYEISRRCQILPAKFLCLQHHTFPQVYRDNR